MTLLVQCFTFTQSRFIPHGIKSHEVQYTWLSVAKTPPWFMNCGHISLGDCKIVISFHTTQKN